jgi:hypothetical protein
MSNLMQSHYDRPQSHNQIQTRWVLPGNKCIFAPSIKVLDLVINPNNASYFPALTGAYACVLRMQLYLNKKLIYKFDAQELIPYMVAESGDNEKQFGINKPLFNTGNNVQLNNEIGLLRLNRGQVDSTSATIKLSVLCDLFNNIGIIDEEMEILIDWEQNLNKLLIPVIPGSPATSVNIQAPYLSYETVAGDLKQPSVVPFRNYIRDQLVVAAVTEGATQNVEIRSNAFNQKTLGRMMFCNSPSSIATGQPEADAELLYNVFGYYMSTPMSQETWNVALNGKNIMTFRNVQNDAVKLSITNDTWGSAYFTSGAHTHLKRSVLEELDDETEESLNGYASYGCVELNQYVGKDLQLTYSRRGEASTTLSEQLVVNVIAEVKCVYDNGVVKYV